MTALLTSAAGVISLLDEKHVDVKTFALKKLDQIVNEFWPEIADSIDKIEILYEDDKFPASNRQLAALVASKVYYHLGSFEDSLNYALGAGPLFDLTKRNEYVETILAKCLDHYINHRLELWPEDGDLCVDQRLKSIVDRMFEQCFKDKQYKQALGIALETRRMDMFERAIMISENVGDMLSYAFRVAMTLIGNRMFRDKILKSLVGLYRGLPNPDYVSMCQCLIYLNDAAQMAQVIGKLSSGDIDTQLMAYQIGFDLYESATQDFLTKVTMFLKRYQAAYFPAQTPATTQKTGGTELSEKEKEGTDVTEAPKVEPMEISDAEMADSTLNAQSQVVQPVPAVSEEMKKHWEQMIQILSGEIPIALHLQFLVRSNKTDMNILRQTKESVRVSICHTATVISNSFVHTGTTSDQFLRDNLDWLARATNWSKFTATGSLGIIHKGHEKEALSLMQSYLPTENHSSAGYSEGGALYALGLIHANHGASIIDYLLTQLRDSSNEMIKHGGCLGLGLAGMGLGLVRPEIYELLKNNLYQDDAVTGEAAGIALGLVRLGSMDPQAKEDLIAYARETQHEKILRGIALGISFLCFGRLEGADELIQELLSDKDALLRRAGVLSVAMAYCGTASNSAIQKLLKVAVSDVNDDVRRAAVMGLGFLMSRTPEQCPSVVSLLAESYNPHVRYGAALAIGIACAGSGNKEAINLIEPLTQDQVNFVRQGALLASAMILLQQTEVTCPKVKEFRTMYSKVLNDKHDDVMAKFGAILAQGIIDAGGRNVTLSLSSRTGHVWLQGAIGMMLFSHYWYWFPMSLCLGLAFTPSCIIAVNRNLQMPVLEFKSNVKPSTFAYPPPIEVSKKEEKERVATAILSVTAKAKRREAEKTKDSKSEAMEIDEEKGEKEVTAKKEEKDVTVRKEEKEVSFKKEEDTKEKEKEGEKPEKKEIVKKEEPSFEMLPNPARVVKQQLRYMEVQDKRWKPVKDITVGGIIIMKDVSPSEPIELVKPVAAASGSKKEDEEEPEPPEPFEYNEED